MSQRLLKSIVCGFKPSVQQANIEFPSLPCQNSSFWLQYPISFYQLLWSQRKPKSDTNTFTITPDPEHQAINIAQNHQWRQQKLLPHVPTTPQHQLIPTSTSPPQFSYSRRSPSSSESAEIEGTSGLSPYLPFSIIFPQ